MILKLKNIVKIKTYLLKHTAKLLLLQNELKKGEDSGFIKNFNRKAFIKNLHKKHIKKTNRPQT